METLDLEQAAEFLKMHPETVRRQAKLGQIPSAKPGKSWVFIVDDLADWLRNQYRSTLQVPQGEEIRLCNSHDVAKKGSGGFVSPLQTENEYTALLGLQTGDKPRNTPTS